MTEKEKMLSGIDYLCWDSELTRERAKAKDICFELNNLKPSMGEERINLLKKLFGNVKGNVWVEPSFYCDYGYNISVGDNFYSNHNCVILDGAAINIGDNVLFGPNVGLYTAGHPVNVKERISGLEYAHPITIGNNVWIGADVTVIGGVTIGDNSIIGGGSVVTKNIPANVIAVGNPCRVIRKISEEDSNLE